MGESSQLKAPNNVEKQGSAIEAMGAAAAKAAQEASLKLSNEGNMKPDSVHKKSDASTPNTTDSFFNDKNGNSKEKRITEDDIKQLAKTQEPEKTKPIDNTAKIAPPDVMKAIQDEKERVKSIVGKAGDATSAAVKNLPELQLH